MVPWPVFVGNGKHNSAKQGGGTYSQTLTAGIFIVSGEQLTSSLLRTTELRIVTTHQQSPALNSLRILFEIRSSNVYMYVKV